MHYDVAVLKLKSNESELVKKNCSFLDYFSCNRSLKLVHLHFYWPWLQYTYEARFTILTYLCIHCSQSFTLEHYFVGDPVEGYTNRKGTKGIFQALSWQHQLLLNISVANIKLDFETYYKAQSKVVKKQIVFMHEFRGKRMMGHAFGRCGFKIKVK